MSKNISTLKKLPEIKSLKQTIKFIKTDEKPFLREDMAYYEKTLFPILGPYVNYASWSDNLRYIVAEHLLLKPKYNKIIYFDINDTYCL